MKQVVKPYLMLYTADELSSELVDDFEILGYWPDLGWKIATLDNFYEKKWRMLAGSGSGFMQVKGHPDYWAWPELEKALLLVSERAGTHIPGEVQVRAGVDFEQDDPVAIVSGDDYRRLIKRAVELVIDNSQLRTFAGDVATARRELLLKSEQGAILTDASKRYRDAVTRCQEGLEDVIGELQEQMQKLEL